jgi:hypothetical protein
MRPVWGRELPVPAIIRRGGSRGWIAALVAGAILGGVSVVPPVLLSRQAAFVLLAVLLGVIGSVDLGFALLPVVALVNDVPHLLAASYLGHAT